jgi:hypothetical protein
MKLPLEKSKGPWKKGKQEKRWTQNAKKFLKKELGEGYIADEDNPQFIFSTINNKLLLGIVNGKINLEELAKKELKNRGMNNTGEFVGFGGDKNNV